MTIRLRCHACRSQLELSEGSPGQTYLCPRCLAPVGIPDAIQAAPSPQDDEILTVLPADEPILRRPSVERDFRRSNRGMLICLGFLAVFGVAGAVGFVASAADIEQPVPRFVVGIGLLGVVGSAIYLVTLRDSPVARGVGFGILALLAVLGALVLAAAAVVIMLFVVCLAMLGHH